MVHREMERAISSYPWKNIERARDLFQKTSLVGREPKVLRSKIDDFLLFSIIGGSENEIIGRWKNQGGKYRPIYIRGIDSINQLVNRASKRSARLSRERTFPPLTRSYGFHNGLEADGRGVEGVKRACKKFSVKSGDFNSAVGGKFLFFFFLQGTPLKLGRVSGRRVSDTRDYKEAYLMEG